MKDSFLKMMKKMKKILLMPDDPKKKWVYLLLFGTGIPALLSLFLMTTGWFHLPVESWEFTATACTFLLFWMFHRREATLKSADHDMERKLDGRMMGAVIFLGTVWCFLTLPFFIPTLSQGYRLSLRCLCGIFMLAAITYMNWKLRAYWAEKCASKKPGPRANSNWVRYELLICMVDLPMSISLVTVLLGCLIIMMVLPELAITAVFTHSKDGLTASDIHSARLSLASAFYGGAVAFHMLLGNAVFSFIQSGRLDTVIAHHSKVKTPQQVSGTNP